MVKDRSMPFQALLAFATIFALTGCGVIYTVPTISERASTGSAYGTDYKVQIVPLTYETAATANLEPYIPPRLPLAFQPDAAEVVLAGAAPLTGLPAIPASMARRMARLGAAVDKVPPIGEPELYRIGVGDVLLLAVDQGATSVTGLPALLTAQSKRAGYTVQDDGAIAVPDAGRIQVAGMTLRDAERGIFRALAAAGIDPSFTLEVAEFRSQRVSVGGAVGGPTLVPITLQPLRLEEALVAAGGISAPDENVTWIELQREGEIYLIGLEHYVADADLGRIVLRDGDRVYVWTTLDEVEAERQRSEDVEQLLEKDRANFEQRLKYGAIEQPYAFVAGEVGRASQVPLPFERTLSLANVLFSKEGGGLDATVADFSQIYVLRRETDPQTVGGLTAYHLDAENVANLAVAIEFKIHANDIVFVRAQPVTNWNRVLSQLTPTPAFLSVARGQLAAPLGAP